MRNVTCVHAKSVPIVKLWDPELQLACDLNVNNHVAIKNTRMVKTYMEIDERVRVLAMIVKYWTKQRVLNEGSYSSDTTCDDMGKADRLQLLEEHSARTLGLYS